MSARQSFATRSSGGQRSCTTSFSAPRNYRPIRQTVPGVKGKRNPKTQQITRRARRAKASFAGIAGSRGMRQFLATSGRPCGRGMIPKTRARMPRVKERVTRGRYLNVAFFFGAFLFCICLYREKETRMPAARLPTRQRARSANSLASIAAKKIIKQRTAQSRRKSKRERTARQFFCRSSSLMKAPPIIMRKGGSPSARKKN